MGPKVDIRPKPGFKLKLRKNKSKQNSEDTSSQKGTWDSALRDTTPTWAR